MRFSRRQILFFALAVLVAGAFAEFFKSKDPALPGAEAFAATSPEVVAVTGIAEKVKTRKHLYYHGVPGKEEAYRQYQMTVVGPQASTEVTIRATGTEDQWVYRLVSLDR